MTAAAKSNGISSGRVQQIIRDLQWTMLLPEIMGADTYKVPDIKTRDHVASVREHADFWLRKLEVLRAHVNSTKDTEAKARLIAAAPDLLEALKQIEDTRIGHWSDGEMRAIARAAIAKATGQKDTA